MKIYNKVVFDIKTLEVLEEITFSYNGDIVLAKGGGGTTTVQGEIDKEYNDRMATIAEKQQAMADEYYSFWESTYKPYETEMIQANQSLIPKETALQEANIGLQQEQTASSRRLLPQQEKLASGLMQNQLASLGDQRRTSSEFYRQALSGVDPKQRMAEATANVEQSFSSVEGANRRNLARMGIDPTSGNAGSTYGISNIDKMKSLVGARTQAQRSASDESFARLNTAMSYGTRGA